ncbi:MAG: RidA family protein [Oscillospiraceae bacterium]|nr:RidA family protein [Oscillospiraceae bacterium]
MLIEKRLEELGIELQEAVAPMANYVTAQRSGDLLFLAGAGPLRDGKATIVGKLGDNMTIEEGYAAARESAINLICNLKSQVGDLDKVDQILKILAFVNCTPDFEDQPAVINGCSDLLVEVFGDKGRHARSAVGTNSLPCGIPVEIVEMVVRIKD